MIQAKGIEKSFGTLKVLKGIDFCVSKSEVVAIMGASGAGKSTLLQILGTLSAPDAGTLVIDGTDSRSLGGKALNSVTAGWDLSSSFTIFSLNSPHSKM